MTIEKKINGSAADLKIIGRLDTSTAPMLEAVIDDFTSVILDLSIDCSSLEYISSAGLRVLLKAQKTIGTQGTMKLFNVNNTIKEVFDITGFTDILSIK